MTKQTKKNLTGTERTALIEWAVSMKTINPSFGKEEVTQQLQSLGLSKSDRTVERIMHDVNKLFTNNPKGWHIDQEIEWDKNQILYSEEVNLETRWLPILRTTVVWYQHNVGINSKMQFPRTLTYRWLRWANYFLQSIDVIKTPINSEDIFVVGQIFAVRDLVKTLHPNTPQDDLEAWLSARPWEGGVMEQRYLDMIDKGLYSKFRHLAGHNDPDITIEKIGISFIANAYMNICSLKEIKDLPESKTYLLPTQQKNIFMKWCKQNNKIAGIEIKVPNIKEPLKIQFSEV